MKNAGSRLSPKKLRRLTARERGAVLVEAAICIPLLLLVILGAVEAGLAWDAKSSTISGVRTATLRAASNAENTAVDYRILQSVVGEVGGENADRIVSISVFEITQDAETSFTNCLATQSGNCVVYDGADVAGVIDGTLTVADFGIGSSVNHPDTGALIDYTCEGVVDIGWCSAERIDSGDVHLGVGIEYEHDWFTNIFPFDPPVFREFVASSTFTDGGVDIDPDAPIAVPFVGDIVLLPTVDFSDGGGISAPNVTASPAFDNVRNGEAGDFNHRNTPTISLTNLLPGSTVCVRFDYRTSSRFEQEDSLQVDIGGTLSDDLITRNGTNFGTAVHCAEVGSGQTSVVFSLVADRGNEKYFIDNLSITASAP